MTWTITRLVGCEHIRSIANGALTQIQNSIGPDGETTGAGRPGKMRVAFILMNSDLRDTGDNQTVSLMVDSGIPFQNPHIALAESVAGYNDNTPLDISDCYPLITITPLSATAGEAAAWDSKMYQIYTQGTYQAALLPAGLTPFNPDTDCIGIRLGIANPQAGQGAVPGSFLVEVDFSHSIAS